MGSVSTKLFIRNPTAPMTEAAATIRPLLGDYAADKLAVSRPVLKDRSPTAAEYGEFLSWIGEVDSDHYLDLFDMTLAWFSARGFTHDAALKAARACCGMESGDS